jgi:hypothetical protein
MKGFASLESAQSLTPNYTSTFKKATQEAHSAKKNYIFSTQRHYQVRENPLQVLRKPTNKNVTTLIHTVPSSTANSVESTIIVRGRWNEDASINSR